MTDWNNPELQPANLSPNRDATLQAIDRIVQQRATVSAALLQASEQSVGQVKRQLFSLGQWFRQPLDRDRVLQAAPALMLCLAYSRDLANDDWAEAGNQRPLDRNRLDDAIRVVADSLAMRPTGQKLTSILAYPALLLFLCLVVCSFIATEIVPTFQSMFDEFGLQMPASTHFLFVISALIRGLLWPLLMLGIAIGMIRWVVLPMYRRWLMRTGRWQHPLASPFRARQRWADWAEHVALLLQSGLSLGEASAVADHSRRGSRLLRTHMPRVAVPAARDDSQQPPHTWTLRPGVLWPDYQLLASAISMPTGAGQVAKLQAIAAEYRDRQRGSTINLAVWVSPLFTILISGFIGFVIVSLFGPLVGLITGLT